MCIYHTCNLPHVQFATHAICNTCNLKSTPISTMEVKRSLPCVKVSPSPEGWVSCHSHSYTRMELISIGIFVNCSSNGCPQMRAACNWVMRCSWWAFGPGFKWQPGCEWWWNSSTNSHYSQPGCHNKPWPKSLPTAPHSSPGSPHLWAAIWGDQFHGREIHNWTTLVQSISLPLVVMVTLGDKIVYVASAQLVDE